MKKTAIAVALAFASFTTVAEAVPKNNTWYLGGTLGWSQYPSIHFPGHNGYTNNRDFPMHENQVAVGALAGYQVNPYFGLEVNYNWLGRINYNSIQVLDNSTGNGYFQSQGIQFTPKFNYPISKKIDIYTKLGAMIWRADTRQRIGTDFIGDYDNGYSPLIGLGIEYSLHKNLATRLDYQWTSNIGDSHTVGTRPDNNLLNIGISYRFNQNKNFSNTDSTSSPITVPVITKPDVTANPKKFIIKTDVLFTFNKSFLSEQGKQELDKLYQQLNFIDPNKENLIILGFSDRIGSHIYNKKLSAKRAKTVAQYLISKGILAQNIFVKGMGDTTSLHTNNCKNIKNRNFLIKCLAPDRRVEVTIKNIITDEIK